MMKFNIGDRVTPRNEDLVLQEREGSVVNIRDGIYTVKFQSIFRSNATIEMTFFGHELNPVFEEIEWRPNRMMEEDWMA